MNQALKYDVFLSYSLKDKPFVRHLAERLRQEGLHVWFDEWKVQRHDRKGLREKSINQGLERSRTLVLIMSKNAFAAEWMRLERHTAIFRDPTNYQRRFIPLRLDDTEIPETLKQFAYVDWRTQDDNQYKKLLIACQPSVAEVQPGEKHNAEQVGSALKSRTTNKVTGRVWSVAITSDGQFVFAGSEGGTTLCWDLTTSLPPKLLVGHTSRVNCIAVTPDKRLIVSGSHDMSLRVWDVASCKCKVVIEGHDGPVSGVAVSPDGQVIVSASHDRSVRVWSLATGHNLAVLNGHFDKVNSVAITSDGRLAVSASNDGTLRVWDLVLNRCTTVLKGHNSKIHSVAVSADGQKAVSGSADRLVRVWDLPAGKLLATLEGHTASVQCVAITPDGQLAFSGSADGTVQVWDLAFGQCIALLEGHIFGVNSVAINLDGRIVISGAVDMTVRVWELPKYDKLSTEKVTATRYTNAKVLLVGDSGVGKTGLAMRLSQDHYEATDSTDAAWASQMKLPHDVSTHDIEREIWLWDFAGQADYRLIHQLYMDETAMAVLVFNPQSDDPFEGLGQWDRDLQRAARRTYKKLLVAGRCDRGGLMVSRNEIERFCQQRGFIGYVETSARTGRGCQKLRETISSSIPWDDIPWIASPRIFKLLKEEILKLKDEGKVLLRMGELKQQLEMRLLNKSFSLEQLRAVVGLLASPGVVWQLEFGDFVLLQPERINAYAAAVIRSVRAHMDEIGCISEERVLAGELDYQDMKRLPRHEEEIVLRAMHQTFVEHGLCLREHTEQGTVLVFPSYFKRERPEAPDYMPALVTYQFSGMLDEIYATLVVRLHHTTTFEKDQLWRFAADFKAPAGSRVGVKMKKRLEGEAEIAIYFDKTINEDTKVTFIRYVHDHLKAKATEVVRVRHYICPNCNKAINDREAVQDRLADGKKDMLCSRCEKRFQLWDLVEEKFASDEFQRRVRELEEQALIRLDNESRELILLGHAYSIAGEAGQIFRQTSNSDWGIDGEIEFKDFNGKASGRRVYLQLKSGDSYLYTRKRDDKEVFTIKEARHAEYWQSHKYPVMLVIRTSDGQIRWMNVTEYLKRQSEEMEQQERERGKKIQLKEMMARDDEVGWLDEDIEGEDKEIKKHGKDMKKISKGVRQIVFDGEPFTALSVVRLRDRMLNTVP
jgi:small GTP-binding protein